MICPYCYGKVTIVRSDRCHCVRCEMFMPSSIALPDDFTIPDSILSDDLDPRGAKRLREQIIRQAADDFFWAWEIRRTYETLPANRMWNEKQRSAFRKIDTAIQVLEEVTAFVLDGDMALLTLDYDLDCKIFMRQLRKVATERYGALDKAAFERTRQRHTKGENNVQGYHGCSEGTEESNPVGGEPGSIGGSAGDITQHGSQTRERS